MYGYIYKITNIINNKLYIGQTVKTPKERFTEHLWCAKNGADTALAKAIRKYGAASFLVETLDCANTKDELDDKERLYIERFDTYHTGYNMTHGGEGGDTYGKRTEEQMRITRSKISTWWKEHNPNHGQLCGPKNGMYGKHHTAEWKARIGEKLKGRKKPAGHGVKVSAALKGRPKSYYSACKYLYIVDLKENRETKEQVRDITKRFNISSTQLKQIVETNKLLFDRYYVKCVSTIRDECSGVGPEMSAGSKREAVE